MSDDSFMWFKQTWFSTMDNWDHYSTFDFSIGKLLKQTGYLVPIDPVYSAKKAGLGRGSARPFCHCKRTQRPNARPKTAAAETISRGSLGRGSARPFLTVNASRPKCGTKCDPRIRKYVWSSWHHRIWRHYPAFFFDRCSYFVLFLLWRLPNLSV